MLGGVRGFWRFEPTYKELKHSPSFPALTRSICFEPTYKELKQGIPVIYTKTSYVF